MSKAPQNHKSTAHVKAKKSFGQHFLRNTDIARIIARTVHPDYVPVLMPDGTLDLLNAGEMLNAGREARTPVLEIGPGMGVLTQCLWEDPALDVKMVEVDAESVVYLRQNFPERTAEGRLLATDFLKLDLSQVFGPDRKITIIGNYPYNISTEILFKLLENRDRIPVLTGMFQKEVGERVCAKPGGKAYGIISVLLQAFYKTEYLFTVEPCEFSPPPQVRSCVIRLRRNQTSSLGCDEKLFTALVKKAFNQRRKTLRNALKDFEGEWASPSGSKEADRAVRTPYIPEHYLNLRAEQLSVEDYIEITRHLWRAGR